MPPPRSRTRTRPRSATSSHDGRTDLVTGYFSQGSTLGSEVNVRYGTRQGLTEEPDRVIDHDTWGVPGTSGEYDQFGSAVAVGDGRADLTAAAVGENKRDPNTLYRGDGAVTVLPGTRSGATGTGATTFRPRRPERRPHQRGLRLVTHP